MLRMWRCFVFGLVLALAGAQTGPSADPKPTNAQNPSGSYSDFPGSLVNPDPTNTPNVRQGINNTSQDTNNVNKVQSNSGTINIPASSSSFSSFSGGTRPPKPPALSNNFNQVPGNPGPTNIPVESSSYSAASGGTPQPVPVSAIAAAELSQGITKSRPPLSTGTDTWTPMGHLGTGKQPWALPPPANNQELPYDPNQSKRTLGEQIMQQQQQQQPQQQQHQQQYDIFGFPINNSPGKSRLEMLRKPEHLDIAVHTLETQDVNHRDRRQAIIYDGTETFHDHSSHFHPPRPPKLVEMPIRGRPPPPPPTTPEGQVPQNKLDTTQQRTELLTRYPGIKEPVKTMYQNNQQVYQDPPSPYQDLSHVPQNPQPVYQDAPPAYQEAQPINQGAPPAYQEAPPVHQNPQSVNPGAPQTYQGVPPPLPNAPSVHQNIQPVNQDAPPTYQNVPPVYQNVPAVNQGVPPAYQNAPAVNPGDPSDPGANPIYHGTPTASQNVQPEFQNAQPVNQGAQPVYHGSPPAYHGAPPTYHSAPQESLNAQPVYQGAPPAHLGAPPPYQGSPPVYQGAPPAHQGALPAYHGAPSAYQGTPPVHQGALPAHQGAPPVPQGAPPVYQGAPPAYHGSPPMHQGAPTTYQGAPPVPQGAPPGYQGAPPAHQGAPPTYQGAPPVYHGAPPAFQGAPPPYQGAPPVYHGAPPSYQGAPSVYQGAPPVYHRAPPVYHGAPHGYQNSPPAYHGAPPMYQDQQSWNQGPVMQQPNPTQSESQYLGIQSEQQHVSQQGVKNSVDRFSTAAADASPPQPEQAGPVPNPNHAAQTKAPVSNSQTSKPQGTSKEKIQPVAVDSVAPPPSPPPSPPAQEAVGNRHFPASEVPQDPVNNEAPLDLGSLLGDPNASQSHSRVHSAHDHAADHAHTGVEHEHVGHPHPNADTLVTPVRSKKPKTERPRTTSQSTPGPKAADQANFMSMFDAWYQAKFEPTTAQPPSVTKASRNQRPKSRTTTILTNSKPAAVPQPDQAKVVDKQALFKEFMTMYKSQGHGGGTKPPTQSTNSAQVSTQHQGKSTEAKASVTTKPPAPPAKTTTPDHTELITLAHPESFAHAHANGDGHAHTHSEGNPANGDTPPHSESAPARPKSHSPPPRNSRRRPSTRRTTTPRPLIDPDLLADINEARVAQGLPMVEAHQLDLRGNLLPFYKRQMRVGRLPARRHPLRNPVLVKYRSGWPILSALNNMELHHQAIHREAGHNLSPEVHRQIHRLLRQRQRNANRNSLFVGMQNPSPTAQPIFDPDLMSDIIDAAAAANPGLVG